MVDDAVAKIERLSEKLERYVDRFEQHIELDRNRDNLLAEAQRNNTEAVKKLVDSNRINSQVVTDIVKTVGDLRANISSINDTLTSGDLVDIINIVKDVKGTVRIVRWAAMVVGAVTVIAGAVHSVAALM